MACPCNGSTRVNDLRFDSRDRPSDAPKQDPVPAGEAGGISDSSANTRNTTPQPLVAMDRG